MAWATDSIRLEAARAIFTGVTFLPIEIGGKVVGYSAVDTATTVGICQDASLRDLCRQLWTKANAVALPVEGGDNEND
jgi:hypothetical protein